METLNSLAAVLEYIRTDVRPVNRMPVRTASSEDLQNVARELDEFMKSKEAA